MTVVSSNRGTMAGETIEELFNRLEECYVTALRAKPPYTVDQLIGQVLHLCPTNEIIPDGPTRMEWI